MHGKSIRLLRDQLAADPNPDADTLIATRLHIRTLLEAECMAGNIAAARAHADVLLRLDDPGDNDAYQFSHLMVLMFNSTELASKTLERNILPFGDWIQHKLATAWASVASFIPECPMELRDTNACVTLPELRAAMQQLRHCVWLSASPLASKSEVERAKGDMVFVWVVTKTFVDMGNLINLYVDVMENHVAFDAEVEKLMQVGLVLTTVQMLRKCIHSAELEEGMDIREHSHTIVPRIARHLNSALALTEAASKEHYKDAILWMLYIGTTYEMHFKDKAKTTTCELDVGDSTELWFTKTLRHHCEEFEITSWTQAKEILGTFVHDDRPAPDGAFWFNKLVGAEVAGDHEPSSLSVAAPSRLLMIESPSPGYDQGIQGAPALSPQSAMSDIIARSEETTVR
jgi:hypothetical protein